MEVTVAGGHGPSPEINQQPLPQDKDLFYLNFFLDYPPVRKRGWVLEAGVTKSGGNGGEKVLPERHLAAHLCQVVTPTCM